MQNIRTFPRLALYGYLRKKIQAYNMPGEAEGTSVLSCGVVVKRVAPDASGGSKLHRI
jgi:hypothetical protein